MSINKENIDQHIFDYLEGNLSREELSEFKSYVKSNPEVKNELEDWKQTYVTSNSNISSSTFSSLKKSNNIYYWSTGIAAAFLFGIGVASFIDTDLDEAPIESKNIIEIVEPTINNEIFTKAEQIPDERIIKNKIIIKKEETFNKPKVESFEPENNRVGELDIKESQQNEIILTPSITKREAKLRAIKINKADKKSINKKKTVDVIDLNSTGF